MAPYMDSGVPRPGTKPQPLGSYTIVFLFTTCTMCLLFLLWRKASTLKTVVAHQLSTWSGEGRIRLSTDEGPPARSFIEDNDDDDSLHDDEPLPAVPWMPAGSHEPPPPSGHSRADGVPLQNPLPVPPKP